MQIHYGYKFDPEALQHAARDALLFPVLPTAQHQVLPDVEISEPYDLTKTAITVAHTIGSTLAEQLLGQKLGARRMALVETSLTPPDIDPIDAAQPIVLVPGFRLGSLLTPFVYPDKSLEPGYTRMQVVTPEPFTNTTALITNRVAPVWSDVTTHTPEDSESPLTVASLLYKREAEDVVTGATLLQFMVGGVVDADTPGTTPEPRLGTLYNLDDFRNRR